MVSLFSLMDSAEMFAQLGPMIKMADVSPLTAHMATISQKMENVFLTAVFIRYTMIKLVFVMKDISQLEIPVYSVKILNTLIIRLNNVCPTVVSTATISTGDAIVSKDLI